MNQQEINKHKKKIDKLLSENLHKNEKLILGISGGPDSMLLVHYLWEFTKKKPLTIIVAHLNHGLRGISSEKDQKLVQQFCKEKNLIFEAKKADIKSLSKDQKKGLEETGRDQRHLFFKELCKKYHTKKVLLAHHADDNAETILMNIIRGSGLNGISGMRYTENLKEITIFRPLLDLTKKEILKLCSQKKVAYRIDRTNHDNNTSRNFLRNTIIPKLEQLNPSVNKTISENAENFREIEEYLNLEANTWLRENEQNEYTAFPAPKFKSLHPALQKAIFRNLYLHHRGHLKNLEKKHLSEILTLINNNIGNKKKKFNGMEIYLKQNIFYISKEDDLKKSPKKSSMNTDPRDQKPIL